MRVLMLLSTFFPPDIRVEKEARTLLKAGHEVLLLCLGKGDALAEEMVDGIKVIRILPPQGFVKRAWDYFWFQVFFIRPFRKKALENAVREHKIEALHIHDLPEVKTGLSVAHKFDIPLIADLHENYPEALKVWGRHWKGRLLQVVWRWKRVEKLCVQQADRVITVVDEAKEHYVNDCGISPEKVTVVMNAEDLEYFHSLPIKKDIVERYKPYFSISYIGGFGPHRGLQTAISAMPRILQEVSNGRLLLVGSGENEIDLRQLARDNGVEEAIEFIGWQNFSLVPSYIAASDVCLVPHIASGHTNSTIPHKLFQCMAMGKPVVVSSAKPLERIIKETGAGLVYPSGDAGALAEAIMNIYRDNNLASNLGKAGTEAVKRRYNWEMGGKKLVDLYRDLQKAVR